MRNWENIEKSVKCHDWTKDKFLRRDGPAGYAGTSLQVLSASFLQPGALQERCHKYIIIAHGPVRALERR